MLWEVTVQQWLLDIQRSPAISQPSQKSGDVGGRPQIFIDLSMGVSRHP